ncbi:unnamed protein product [Protopolystoma xenopodis]|uniref:Uncharacterized protein n=1 Tax=Protopolystoma xenopodis TaxID=117903 RepID=A0A3S5CJ68_9PLAT|nr:unnamed protein product [Protopolystoma xenopodis]
MQEAISSPLLPASHGQSQPQTALQHSYADAGTFVVVEVELDRALIPSRSAEAVEQDVTAYLKSRAPAVSDKARKQASSAKVVQFRHNESQKRYDKNP